MNGNDKMTRRERVLDRTAAIRWTTPAVDLYEDNDDLILRADLPGVDETDLQLQVSRGVLTLEAALPTEDDNMERGYYRQFRLSDRIDADAGEAALKDGVLTLRLPKNAAEKPRQIAVKTLH
jgi:HSP20 family molecular chaperone IbpA